MATLIQQISKTILALALILIAAQVCLACLCDIRSLSKRKGESRNVFVGTVVNRVRETREEKRLWRNEFVVERYWKGKKSSALIVYTTLDDCASWFEIGKKYLVFAYYVKELDHLQTGACMGTGPADMKSEDLKRLGTGKSAGR